MIAPNASALNIKYRTLSLDTSVTFKQMSCHDLSLRYGVRLVANCVLKMNWTRTDH